MSRLSTLALGVIALAGTPFAAARAQDTADPYNPSRFTLEPYLSYMWLDSDASSREGQGGFGVRMMFGHADVSQTLSTFFNRARAGAFVTYNSAQGDAELKSIHYGVEADFPLLAAPRIQNPGFRLDPFIGLGLGMFHASVPSGTAGTRLTSDDFSLTPSIGTLVPITGEIKFRGDVRDAIVFGEGKTSNNFVLEGGISIGF